MSKKKNKKKSLKTRIKKYMRENDCAITPYDLPNKFVRGMTLSDAIEFLAVLESKDALISKSEIEDVHSEGVIYSYHYKYKKKKRGGLT